MYAQYPIHDIAEDKERESAYAIQAIEETIQDILRRNGYSAERTAEEMSRFAQGYSDLYVQSKASSAVWIKMRAMVEALLRETGLSALEINELILMITYG